MSEERFTWKTEKLQHLDDEIIMVVDNENKEWKGHILNIVDKLNELAEENDNCKNDYRELFSNYVALEEKNEQLRQILKDIVGATEETYTKNASVFKVTVVLDFEKYMEIRRCIE